MELPKARDIMTRKLITIQPEESIYKAVDLLLKHEISGMPVVDENGELVGIISEKDCLEVLTLGGYHGLRDGHVSEYMTQVMLTVDPDADILEIARLFEKYPYRRIPVLENGKLVGLVSRRDVLKAIHKLSSMMTTKF